MSAPSSLPDFATLATDIALEAQREAPSPGVQLDWFLGELADKKVEVHRRVVDHLMLWTSRPNRVHRAVAALAVASPVARVVTTNYDLHLSSALQAASAEFDEYVGPALPMGDDFSGVVYLHGRLGKPARQLVVTAEDFGRAYLRDAWAARFLERMFATFSVLFVGYSHSDVVMRYLARALGPGKKRYTLTDDAQAPEWTTLGITPLEFPNPDRSFSALPEAIEGWAEIASMGALDHQQRLRRLLSSAPSQIPEDQSYLRQALVDPEQLTLFTDLARGADWLEWATTQEEFQRLFDPTSVADECTYLLAYWFAKHFAMDARFSGEALRVITSFDSRIGRPLWGALAQTLHGTGKLGDPRPEWLRHWPVLLMETAAPDAPFDFLGYALSASSWLDERSTTLLLFDYLSQPILRSRRPYGLGGPFSAELSFRGTGYGLEEARTKVFGPVLPDAAPDLLLIVERHLHRAYHLLAATDSGPPRFDPVSFRRSAIAAIGPASRPSEPIDVLIDLGRDALVAGIAARNGLGTLEAWGTSEAPILRRLAAHGWSRRGDLHGTAKIDWLLSGNRLSDRHLRTEVLDLVENALPTTTLAMAESLVAEIVALGEALDGQSRFYLLGWTAARFPRSMPARNAFREVEKQHPGLALGDRPAARRRFEFTRVEQQLPMSTGDLHRRLAEDAAGVVAELLGYTDVEFPDDGPTWTDARQLVTQTVREWPSDGFVLLEAEQASTLSAVVSGWAMADLDDAAALRVLQRLETCDVMSIADELSRLLRDGGRSELNPTRWDRLPQARVLARRVWATPPPEVDVDASEEASRWLEHSINSTHGRLAEFWMYATAGDWEANREHWTGIPDVTKLQLEYMLETDDLRSVMAEVALASQLRFFASADWEWCKSELLPLFAWSNPARARRIWDAYLHTGLWTDELLDAGLLEEYLGSVSHQDQLLPEVVGQLVDYLASIALFSKIRPTYWLRRFTVVASADNRREWIERVSWAIESLEPSAVEQQWQRWLKQYWHERLNDMPLPLTDDEASAIAGWAVHLTETVDEAVSLATSRPAGLFEHDVLLRRLAGERVQQAPRAFGKLIAHLLKGTHLPCWSLYELPDIVTALRASADPGDLEIIKREAVRLRVPLDD
jgi:hypothetical protein